MKYTKKLLSLVLVLVLALALAVPGFAANTTVNITNGNSNAKYDAYQIMSLVQKGENYAYTVTEEWISDLAKIAGIEKGDKTDAAFNNALVQYVSEQKTAEATRALAEALFAKIGDKTAANTDDKDSSFEVPQGYYLIVETSNPGTGEVKSLVMLDTANNTSVDIKSKSDTVTVEKKVNDQDAINAEFGEVVNFKITSTIPSNIAQYTNYTFTIKDTMSAGLDFKAITSVKVDGSEVPAYAAETQENGYKTTGFFTGSPMNGNGTIELGSYILANKTTLSGKSVEITYTATVNNTAIIDGTADSNNNNAVVIEFSNDYHATTTGKTVEDKVTISVFDIDINKNDGKGQNLSGAEFQLTNAEGEYATVTGENGNYKFKAWVEDDSSASKLVSPANGNIALDGLKAGTYTLTETKAPEGYNLLDAPIKVVIDNNGDVTADEKAAETINVVNKTGTELPSTGGMGTTIFYTLGGVLVVGAAILLVTKKRVHDVEG